MTRCVKVIGVLLIAFLMISCANSSEIEALKGENEELITIKKENEDLKLKTAALEKELNEIKFGPENLLKEAKAFFQNKDLNKLKANQDTFNSKHPSAPEMEEVKKMVTELEELFKKEEEAKALAAKKAQEEKELAEKKKKEEEAKRTAEATSKMRKKYDEVSEITWYHDKATTQYVNHNSFHLYFGQKANTKPVLRLVVQYAGEDWVFIDKYIIKADDKTFEIAPRFGDVKSDNSTIVWEWYVTNVSKTEYEIIKAVVASEKTIVRHQGDQKRYDRTITAAEKQAMQNVLDAFVGLGGSLGQFE